jgi:uncharacterized protein YndB with AHSA1/START domain
MPRQQIEVVQDFTLPVEQVFAFFAEHENLSKVMPFGVKRVTPGPHGRYGVGSTRRLTVAGVAPIDEEITAFEENALIEYRMTSPGPMRNYVATQRFATHGHGGTRLTWTIAFDAVLPGSGRPLAKGMELGLRRGLRGAQRKM